MGCGCWLAAAHWFVGPNVHACESGIGKNVNICSHVWQKKPHGIDILQMGKLAAWQLLSEVKLMAVKHLINSVNNKVHRQR